MDIRCIGAFLGRMDGLFPSRWKHDRPPPIADFLEKFRDDYACAEYLAEQRWPGGFRCPVCGGRKAWRLEARPWVFECAGTPEGRRCGKQTSVIAGTVMHGTHLPLQKWFLAAYLMATHSNAISALKLQPKLDVSYKTAWLLLHKLRRTMVNPDRKPLQGVVEVDETSIPFRTKHEPVTGGQGRSEVGKLVVIGAVEIDKKHYAGRIRLKRIPDFKGETLRAFVVENTAAGSTIVTDGNKGYVGLPDRGTIRRT